MYLTVKPGVRVGGVLGSMGGRCRRACEVDSGQVDRGDICHKSLVCGWGVSWGRWAGRCQRACETDGRTAGSLPWNRQTTAVMMTAYTHMCMHQSGCGAFPGSRSERVFSVSRIHKEIRIRNTTSCPFDWARVDVAGDDAPRTRLRSYVFRPCRGTSTASRDGDRV